MSIKELDLSNFGKIEELVLVDFYATWCGPCNMLAPIIEDISKEYAGKVRVCKINVDEERDLALKYEIESIPTIMFFKNAKPIKTSVGFHSKTELKNIIDELIQK